MSQAIYLASSTRIGATAISNIFLDTYMPKAPGEFVKVYLYLLRWLPFPDHPLSLGIIADTFEMTEKDVLRALKCFQTRKLLALQMDEAGQLAGIQILDPPCPSDKKKQCLQENIEEEAEITLDTTEVATPETTAVITPAPVVRSDKKNYSMSQIKEYSETPGGMELLFILQQYMGRTLSPTDLNTIYFFHDELHFSDELITYLFEYCISGEHRNMRYIEKVALAWAEKGIKGVEEAKRESAGHNQLAFAVFKALGLKDHTPTAGELDYINRWSGEYGLSQELVLEACKRTIMNVHSPSFDYADKILSNWKGAGITTLTQVQAADEVFSSQKKTQTPASKKSTNKFNNFSQRKYDYSALEKQLASKIHGAGPMTDETN